MFTLLFNMGIKIWLRSVRSDSVFSADYADDLLRGGGELLGISESE